MILIFCVPWIVPLIWALITCHVRQARDRDKISALAIGGVVIFFAIGFSLGEAGGANFWLQRILVFLLLFVYFGMSWGAVVWAHRGESDRVPPRGFPIEPVTFRKVDDDQ